MPKLRTMLFPRPQRFGRSWVLLLVAGSATWGCASEEIPTYGDPARVAGGVGGGGVGGSTTTSVMCDVDPACAVSFKDDIFPVLDTTSKCATTTAKCHGEGIGNLTLVEGDAASYYKGFKECTVKNAGDCIVPCDPDSSKLLCNFKVSAGTNKYGKCGKLTMPIKVADAPTEAQLQAIADWITCGAPDN
jgi:hypothetical protein